MIELDQLVVAYGKIRALHGVSVAVPRGQVVGVVGPNGAGKTSMMHAICGVVRPAEGSITVDGVEVHRRGLESIARLGVRLVPEGRRVLSTLTVEENLKLGATGRRKEDASESIESILDRFPVLRDRAEQPAGQLSGGEQQMLAIGRALAAQPTVLLLDEPTLGLAPRIVDEVFGVIDELRSEGYTVLVVEQNVHRTVQLADYSYVLNHGDIVMHGSADELLSQRGLIDAYLGG